MAVTGKLRKAMYVCGHEAKCNNMPPEGKGAGPHTRPALKRLKLGAGTKTIVLAESTL